MQAVTTIGLDIANPSSRSTALVLKAPEVGVESVSLISNEQASVSPVSPLKRKI